MIVIVMLFHYLLFRNYYLMIHQNHLTRRDCAMLGFMTLVIMEQQFGI